MNKKVLVQFVTSPGCQHCEQARKIFNELKPQYKELEVEEIDITTSKGMDLAMKHSIFASPGIIVNGEPFSTGGLNKEKFVAKLKSL